MEKQILDWYIREIAKKTELLLTKKYIGNIKFQFNLRDGGITNVNIDSNESIQAPKPNKEIS